MAENELQKKRTRIKLRIDTAQRWQVSKKPLLEGEIGISYENVYNPQQQVIDKKNFKIRIGKKIGNHCFLWKDSPELSFNLTQEQKDDIIEQIKEQLGDTFTKKEDFQTAIDAIEDRITVIETRLVDRVTAWVSGTLLTLSEGDKPTIS